MTFIHLFVQLIIFSLYYDAIDYQFFIRGTSIRECLYLGIIIVSSFIVHRFSDKNTLLTPYTVYLTLSLWILTLIAAFCLFTFSPWQFVPVLSRDGPDQRETIIQPRYFVYLSTNLFLTVVSSMILTHEHNKSWKRGYIIFLPFLASCLFLLLLYTFQGSRPIYNG